tara:strand:- start:573 stop:3086 length:2514 start_codon:yes stop_codon:yes gene_type:complete
LKKLFINILISFLLSLIVLGCSRKKDKFLNKNFHALTTKYNFLFNGNNLYAEGLLEIENDIRENFWTLLPIEKFKFYDLDDEERETNFTKAEEKATLSIQKHSMNVDGKERNPIMDQAYFLLGKSRYFDNRFIPALEAFNYILYKYPTSQYINKVKIWKEKINIRLDQNKYAIDNLKELLREDNLLIEERSMANSYLAQAFINLEQVDSASYYLKRSNQQHDNIKDNPRKTFLLAQLYQDLMVNDSAYKIYSKIIHLNRRTTRNFYIQSHINRSTVSDSIENSILELKELAENFENKNFLDVIYHQIAMLNLEKNNSEITLKETSKIAYDSLAIIYFNKSLRSDSDDEILISKNYSELAELNFRNKEYLQAGLYYDSTLNVLNSKSREFRKVKKKRDNLKDLIFYETLSIELDSIINLIKMSDANRIVFFNDYINKISEKNNKQKNKNKNLGTLTSSISNIDSESILFYFYNSNAVAFGKNEFKNRWGNRKLQDDWRWSASNASSNDKNNKKKYNELNKDSILSADYYISLIPNDPKVIDSLNNTRNDTYYRLGAIYKDQFEEYEISNFNFFSLLDNNPVEELVAPTKYFIYKNLLSLDSIFRAETFKEDIIQNHRSSKYAEILLNPNLVLEQKQNSNEIYEKIYVDFSNQDFLDVIEQCDKSILEFSGEPIVAKFEFLKSLAIAKVYGFKEYEKALNYIKLNYSSTAEGKEAELILDEVLPVVKNDKFVNNNLSENYKIIYQFDRESNDLILSELKKIEKYINNVDYLDLRVSKDFYNNIITFVVVHGLKSYDGGLGLVERLENSIDIQANSFSVISTENYKTIQIHKNLDKFENK